MSEPTRAAEGANFQLRAAGPADFRPFAALIVEHSLRPERRCIHSDPRSGVDAALAELEHLNDIGELCFVVATRQGQLAGCAGAEFDRGLRRAWLRGPFVETEHAHEWAEYAGNLLEALQQYLPEEITILDSFLDQANQWGGWLFQASGFERVREVHVYQTDAASPLSQGQAGCIEMLPEHAGRVAALHEQLFPNTYLTAQQIIAATQEPSGAGAGKVYVYVENGQVLGYVYGSENLGEGVVDFIGVDASARRRGVGRALLSAMMYWLRVEQGLDAISLTVHDELVNARALYEQAGFRLLYTGVHRRKLR